MSREPEPRERVVVRGVVQGVGFRPFVHRLAHRLGLTGWARNDTAGVVLEVAGPAAARDAFVAALRAEAPALATIHEVVREPAAAPATPESGFRIVPSQDEGARRALVPPDVAPCPECLRELRDPADRRHGYPFLNCTGCGPRYTILETLPYDRPATTMRRFALCPACRAEYEDPADRRYHAQPTACPACGPQLRLLDTAGRAQEEPDPLGAAVVRLRHGEIVAVKGLGGFHLACDATNEAAVAALRRRKPRPTKPLAVMSASVRDVRSYAAVRDNEARLLESPAAPIVLLEKRHPSPLAAGVAPGVHLVGAMLPSTPLHHLLCASMGGPLVMTSGNRRGQPLVRRSTAAVARLRGAADAFLSHDRGIRSRADDSVMRVVDGAPRFLRRSRGYVPAPIPLPRGGAPVLAVGGDLRGAICLTRDAFAFPGPHVGDLAEAANLAFLAETAAQLAQLLDVAPELVVHDAHPDYRSTRWATETAGRPTLAVQHHHAHILSCVAENGHEGPVLGVALDGTGWGPDGTSWGGELLAVDGLTMRRLGHLRPLPLAGGDRVAREPWRMALALLQAAFGPAWREQAPLATLDPIPRKKRDAVSQLLDGPLADRLPRSSGLGRFLDGCASLCGLCHRNEHDGQAPMELEAAAATWAGSTTSYPWSADGGVLDLAPAVRALVADVRAGHPIAALAANVHETVVEAFSEETLRVAADAGLPTVALSGGAFHNALLLRGLSRRLAASGLVVLTHRQVPAGDGGLSLGQAWAGCLHVAR